jgi:hypothetical protein
MIDGVDSLTEVVVLVCDENFLCRVRVDKFCEGKLRVRVRCNAASIFWWNWNFEPSAVLEQASLSNELIVGLTESSKFSSFDPNAIVGQRRRLAGKKQADLPSEILLQGLLRTRSLSFQQQVKLRRHHEDKDRLKVQNPLFFK